MRFLLIALFSSLSTQLFAQNINGFVKDAVTKLPISNAQVISATHTILTTNTGQFTIGNLKMGETIAIRMMGYETAELTIGGKMLTDSVYIYLKQDIVALKEIMVKTNRNYKLDSVSLRKEYAKVFTYKGPGFTDMFIKRDPGYRSPFAHVNPNSTTSLVSLNVLQVVSLLTKKKEQNTKLKKLLLKDEHVAYVDHLFSKTKITSLTKLSGDSLVTFMNLYRPSIPTLKKMTDYDLNIYIKKSYKEFIKPKSK